MSLKTIVAMFGRKSVTLSAGVLMGLYLAAEYPAVLIEFKEYIAASGGLAGLVTLAMSLFLSINKERENSEKVTAALYSSPPNDRQQALSMLKDLGAS